MSSEFRTFINFYGRNVDISAMAAVARQFGDAAVIDSLKQTLSEEELKVLEWEIENMGKYKAKLGGRK